MNVQLTCRSILALALVSLLYGCDRKECGYFDHKAMSSCFEGTAWDTVQVAGALIGTWQLRTGTCPNEFASYDVQGNRRMSLEVTFGPDQTLEAVYDSDLAMSATWRVVQPTSSTYSLSVDPWMPELAGFVQLCDDIVEFSNSGLDGVDEFFYRR